MPEFTIFYRHPLYAPEGRCYKMHSSSAKAAGGDAIVYIPDALTWDKVLDIPVWETVLGELEIVIYEGSHSIKPDGPPAWEFH